MLDNSSNIGSNLSSNTDSNFAEMVRKSGNESVNTAGNWVNLVSREIDTKTNKVKATINNADQAEIVSEIAQTVLIDPISWVQKLFNSAKEQYYQLDEDGGNESFIQKRQRLFVEEVLREQELRKNPPSQEMSLA